MNVILLHDFLKVFVAFLFFSSSVFSILFIKSLFSAFKFGAFWLFCKRNNSNCKLRQVNQCIIDFYSQTDLLFVSLRRTSCHAHWIQVRDSSLTWYWARRLACKTPPHRCKHQIPKNVVVMKMTIIVCCVIGFVNATLNVRANLLISCAFTNSFQSFCFVSSSTHGWKP